jgi:transposase InsO family protein
MKIKLFWWWWTNLANVHTSWSLTHPHTASSVAKVFMNGVYKLHGLPVIIVSDRDSIFLSQFWKQLFINQEVDLHYSTVYYLQSNGRTKIVNKFLENYLRCMIEVNYQFPYVN